MDIKTTEHPQWSNKYGYTFPRTKNWRAGLALVWLSILLGLSGILVPSSAQAKPDYYFDKGTAPEWTRALPSSLGQPTLRAVASIPVSTNVQADIDKAKHDAMAQIARIFSSQIDSTHLDWQSQFTSGHKAKSQALTRQQINVKSNIRIVGASVSRRFREKQTRMQFVEVLVETNYWSGELKRGLSENLEELEKLHQKSKFALRDGQVTIALKFLHKGVLLAQSSREDANVLQQLRPDSDIKKRLRTLTESMKGTADYLRNKTGVVIDIQSTSTFGPKADIEEATRRALHAAAESFGLVVSNEPNRSLIHLKATLSERFVSREKVGSRVDFIHAAAGSIKVVEPSGAEATYLSVQIENPADYTEYDAKQQTASSNTLQLASDTLVSLFNSKFRKFLNDN